MQVRETSPDCLKIDGDDDSDAAEDQNTGDDEGGDDDGGGDDNGGDGGE